MSVLSTALKSVVFRCSLSFSFCLIFDILTAQVSAILILKTLTDLLTAISHMIKEISMKSFSQSEVL